MSDRRHPQTSRDQGPKDFEAREWRAPTIPAPTNPFTEWNQSNIPGGRQQHRLGFGAQMPLNRPGYDDSVGQDLPQTSNGKNTLFKKGHVSNSTSMASVQQGKQKALQEGHASTAEPSAEMSDIRLSEEQLTRLYLLYLRAKKIPRGSKNRPWSDEHKDFFEAYVAFYTKPDKTVNWDAMRSEYGAFFGLYDPKTLYKRASDMRDDRAKLSNNWQKLELDEDGNEI